MRELGRTWAALAALGAGLVHLDIASRSTPGLLTAFVLLGVAELVWAVVTLARHRVPAPACALATAVVAPALWGVLVLAGAGGTVPVGSMIGASGLDLCAAALLAGRSRVRRGAAPGVAASLAGLVSGSLAVTAIAGLSIAAGQPAGTTMPGMGM